MADPGEGRAEHRKRLTITEAGDFSCSKTAAPRPAEGKTGHPKKGGGTVESDGTWVVGSPATGGQGNQSQFWVKRACEGGHKTVVMIASEDSRWRRGLSVGGGRKRGYMRSGFKKEKDGKESAETTRQESRVLITASGRP